MSGLEHTSANGDSSIMCHLILLSVYNSVFFLGLPDSVTEEILSGGTINMFSQCV